MTTKDQSEITVLVCDDNEDYAPLWAKDLQTASGGRAKVEWLRGEHLVGAITTLTNRHRDAKAGRPQGDSACPFDDYDVLALDYDLLDLTNPEKNLSLPGETTGGHLAYLARCFSNAKLLIVLNEVALTPTFDLDVDPLPNHFADLHLSTGDLSNPNLWIESGWGLQSTGNAFRPWYWPCIPRYLQQLDAMEKLVGENLDAPILGALGFPVEGARDVTAYLPREALEFILPPGEGPNAVKSVTFAQFRDFGPGARIPAKTTGGRVSLENQSRVIGARLLAWLERILLYRQDLLIDAPHLVSRLPSVLRGDPRARASWNDVVLLGESVEGLATEALEEARFARPDLLSRPAWFWPLLAGNEAFAEIASPWARGTTPFVFCEDVSRFVERESARDFVANTSSPTRRRYVVRPSADPGDTTPDGVSYEPAMNFAL